MFGNVVTKKGVQKDGKVVIPCLFDEIEHAMVDGMRSEDIYVTSNDDLFGLAKIVDEAEGKIDYIDPEYSSIGEFKNGVSIVGLYCERFGAKYGLIDTSFNEQLECLYDEIKWLTDELLTIRQDGLYGVYSLKKEKIIVPTGFSGITYFGWGKEPITGLEQLILDL